jgi:hypothetical protein
MFVGLHIVYQFIFAAKQNLNFVLRYKNCMSESATFQTCDAFPFRVTVYIPAVTWVTHLDFQECDMYYCTIWDDSPPDKQLRTT